MNTKKRVLYKRFDDYDRQGIIKCLDREIFSKFLVRSQFWSSKSGSQIFQDDQLGKLRNKP